ncbi:MAG TPA: hypothetical protein VGN55_10190 [Xanthobacteraceae bacterium]
MLNQSLARVVFRAHIAVTLLTTIGGARAADDVKYPTNWKGEWTRVIHREVEVQGAFDQTKTFGLRQEAPLTPEYQKVLADSMADQANGGLGNYPTARCLPSGMPRIMTFGTQEYVITPATTYILLSGSDHLRRVFTDGRDWPKNPQPTYGGYSIGRWVDEDGDGRYDLLEVETRYFKGPRAFDASGLPLAFDNQSVFKERIFIDKTNPDIIHLLTTVIDNALTRPWTSDRQYMRVAENVVQFPETWCQEGNHNILIGKENYLLRSDGLLMPSKKNQAPPDLRYFTQLQK